MSSAVQFGDALLENALLEDARLNDTRLDDARRDLLRRCGDASTSFQTLARGLSYHAGQDGYLAYQVAGRAWLTVGPPVAPLDQLTELSRDFVRVARQQRCRPRFVAVSRAFVEGQGLSAIQIGEEPFWDPRQWSFTLTGAASLREQLRRARRKGVQVSAMAPTTLLAESERPESVHRGVERLRERWLATRALPPLRFMVQVDLFRFASERRYWVAHRPVRTDAPVGLLVAAPVFASGGWLIEHLLRDPDAPNGTAELLIDAFLKQTAEEGCTEVSMGVVPLAGAIASPLKWLRRAAQPLYSFDGLQRFRAKLRPARWEPRFLAYPRREPGVLAVTDVLRAFAPSTIDTAGGVGGAVKKLVGRDSLAP